MHTSTLLPAFAVAAAIIASPVSASVAAPSLHPATSHHTVRLITITGRVVDAQGRPLGNARVSIDALRLATESRDDGSFMLPDVPTGTHTVSVRLIGYAKQTQSVTVAEGKAVAPLTFTLEKSANTLSDVVVTGTVIETEQRELPNPITVISAEEIERQGVTTLSELFRGQIPGVIAPDAGVNNEGLNGTAIYVRGSAELNANSNSIKIYVDGVELTNSRALTSIDPSTIARIELLRGPQASTIYGSDAIGGVMQIFTKRSSSATRPQLTLTSSYTALQNGVTSAHTPQNNVALTVQGTGENFSYSATGSYMAQGAWQPGTAIRNYAGQIGMRRQEGPVTANLSWRQNKRTNLRGSNALNLAYMMEGTWYWDASQFIPSNELSTSGNETYGATLDWTPTEWMSQTVRVGRDQFSFGSVREKPRFINPTDTVLALTNNSTSTKTSLAYNLTMQGTAGENLKGTLTVGADMWTYRSNSWALSSATGIFGSLTPVGTATPSISRYKDWNRGALATGLIGLYDKVFLTFGLRAEDNPNFGNDYGISYSPRYGIAVEQKVSSTTLKFRGSYGRATRAPAAGAKDGRIISSTFFFIANPLLAPANQQGGDFGIDAYFGKRGSLVATYYSQKVNGIIDFISRAVLAVQPDPPVTPRIPDTTIRQYLNAGDVRNTGIELEGALNLGLVNARGTYTIQNSKVIRIAPYYWTAVERGIQLRNIPERTGGLSFRFNRSRKVSSDLDITYRGKVRAVDYMEQQRRQRDRFYRCTTCTNGEMFLTQYPAVVRINVGTSYRFTNNLEGALRVKNLQNATNTEWRTDQPGAGRQTMLSLKVRW